MDDRQLEIEALRELLREREREARMWKNTATYFAQGGRMHEGLFSALECGTPNPNWDKFQLIIFEILYAGR